MRHSMCLSRRRFDAVYLVMVLSTDCCKLDMGEQEARHEESLEPQQLHYHSRDLIHRAIEDIR